MVEHRDSPESEPERVDEPRATASRRFARMVETPAARRVALPRLAMAVGILSGVVVLVGLVGSKLIRIGTGWVASRPEYQLPFSEIELIPPPDPWVKGGKSLILEQVRAEAKHGETIPLLGLDSEALKTDFKRCAWVKDVTRIERGFGRLAIHLVYRKPVAVVVLGKINPIAYPVDEEAVALEVDDIDWTEKKDPPFQARGIPRPLIEIRGVSSAKPTSPGLKWKRADSDEPDPTVLGAASLARFLQERAISTPKGCPAPRFVRIDLPDEPNHPFFLIDSEKNQVRWGKPPGDEKLGEPSSEARWDMLLDWVDRNGPLKAIAPSYLYFTRSEARIMGAGTDRRD